ncbi:MAG: M56 family metallopeptidase [Gemmatimonadota bacterium]
MTLLAQVFVVGGLLTGAALLLERGLHHLGWPVRGVWLGALLGSTLLPLLAWQGAWSGWRGWNALAGGGLPDPVGVMTLEPLRLVLQDVSPGWWQALPPVVTYAAAAIWLLGSTGLVGMVCRQALRLRGERQGWFPSRLEGTPVLLSENRGPAVVGLVQPEIVLPRWVSHLPPGDRRLILAHEESHRRAGDTRMLFMGLALVAIIPWSPFLWWQFRRLRLAVEADCDARVLRGTGASVAAYGRLLLEVGGRSHPSPLPLPALAEPPSTLERRIRTMIRPTPRYPVLRALPYVGLGTLLTLWACDAPDPGAQAVGPQEVQAPAFSWTQVAEQPTFTPFTVRPEITNMGGLAESLEREYPPLLRDAGIGGTVVVWFLIDERGQVRDTKVNESSGHQALDEAALRTAQTFQWTPARNGDETVPVWIALPITFQPR